nr:mitochondrial dicarboxylate/tricarboxylate transporter DTC-like [Ipomoea batatas]
MEAEAIDRGCDRRLAMEVVAAEKTTVEAAGACVTTDGGMEDGREWKQCLWCCNAAMEIKEREWRQRLDLWSKCDGGLGNVTNKAIEANDGKPLPLYQKPLCGLTTGAIGACVGNPTDLALIRMQADATLLAAQRRDYANASSQPNST